MAIRIIVSGNGEIKRRPELGILNLRVYASGRDQARVSSDVRETIKIVQDQLKPLVAASNNGDPSTPAVKEWSSGLLSTYSYEETVGTNRRDDADDSPRVRTHQATVDISATFADFACLTDFSTAMSSVAHAEVRNVDWVLSSETKLRLSSEVIGLACSNAQAKANAYAAALGKTSITPVEIDEFNDSIDAFGGTPRFYAMGASGAAGDDRERLLCVPQDVSLSVTCKATFQIE